MYQQHHVNYLQRYMITLSTDSGCLSHMGRQPRALENVFQVGSIIDQYLPNPVFEKRHHEISAEMDLGIFTRHTRANVKNVEVQCH